MVYSNTSSLQRHKIALQPPDVQFAHDEGVRTGCPVSPTRRRPAHPLLPGLAVSSGAARLLLALWPLSPPLPFSYPCGLQRQKRTGRRISPSQLGIGRSVPSIVVYNQVSIVV